MNPAPVILPTMTELLEEKFRKVEQESARRALDEPGELSQRELEDLRGPRKHRKKPVVSVSQFGQQEGQGNDSPAPSPLSAVASKSTFYHTLANPRSVDSFVCMNSEQESDCDYTEEQHEIQVERIAGRQSFPKTVGALLPRRLTCAQSQLDYAPNNRGMIINVSVETITELSRFSPDLHTSIAYATRPSRPRANTIDVLTSHMVERAKDFARKLRRKSRG